MKISRVLQEEFGYLRCFSGHRLCAGQMELDKGEELALVQMNFSAAFDRVNQWGLVFELQEAGVGGTILKMFQFFFCPVALRELR